MAPLILLLLLLLCSSALAQLQGLPQDLSSVAIYGGGRSFHVAVLSETLSVVCSNGGTISCQAVSMHAGNQTLVGSNKEVAAYQDFVDLALVPSLNAKYVMVCYSTVSYGTKCTTLTVDEHFGLLQNERQTFVCAKGQQCQELALAALPSASNKTFALCYTGVETSSSYCDVLTVERNNNAQVSLTATSHKLTAQGEQWGSTSLFLATDKELMLCAVLTGTATQTAKCRLVDASSLQFIPKKQILDNLHQVSVIGAAYLGRIQLLEYSIVCYLQQRRVWCQVVVVSQQQHILKTGPAVAFPAEYASGLDGLRIQSLTDNLRGDAVLSCVICLASVEDMSELMCTLATVLGASGTLQLDPYEMVVDDNGFYVQNVHEALETTHAVGGYVEASLRVSGDALTGAQEQENESYLSDVTVLPDFYSTFNQTDNRSSIASIGCVNVGFQEFDKARYCIGARSKLSSSSPHASLSPIIPPEGYCAVTERWECTARGDKCVYWPAISGGGGKCTSKYDCTVASASRAQCDSLAAQGALCAWEAGSSASCQPTYDWDASTMCGTIKAQARCVVRGLGCGWFAGQCHATPYCAFAKHASQCAEAEGCVWVGRRCAVAAA